MRPLLFLFLLLMTGHTAIAQDLTAMTYNIRYDNPNDNPNHWGARKDRVVDLIRYYGPDFLGTQEGMPHQVRYLDSALTNYAFVGISREGGTEQGEFSALFYRDDKFSVLRDSTFWLSPTPTQVASKGWDANLPRIVTYALLEERATGRRLWVFNTHFDHIGVQARAESARLVVEAIQRARAEENLPVILMGDFNAEPDKEPIQILTTALADARAVSRIEPYGPEGTFSGFNFDQPLQGRIDYIFVDPDGLIVQRYAALDDFYDFKYPSDHLPVLVSLLFQ